MERRLRFNAEGERLAAMLHLPEGVRPGERRPGVILCNTLAAVKEMVVPVIARGLARAGFAVLTFDYRSFGESEGEPRCAARPWAQVEDVRAAVTCLQQQPEVDGAAIAACGTGLGGGVAIAAAAGDERIAAVATLAPVGDGERWLRGLRSDGEWAAVLRRLARDRQQRARTGYSEYVTAIGTAGFAVAPCDDGSLAYVERAYAASPTLRRQVTLASVEAIADFVPEALAGRLSPRPLLLIAAPRDHLVPAREADAIYRRAKEPRTVAYLPADMVDSHYDLYGEPAATAVLATLAAWLREHLPIPAQARSIAEAAAAAERAEPVDAGVESPAAGVGHAEAESAAPGAAATATAIATSGVTAAEVPTAATAAEVAAATTAVATSGAAATEVSAAAMSSATSAEVPTATTAAETAAEVSAAATAAATSGAAATEVSAATAPATSGVSTPMEAGSTAPAIAPASGQDNPTVTADADSPWGGELHTPASDSASAATGSTAPAITTQRAGDEALQAADGPRQDPAAGDPVPETQPRADGGPWAEIAAAAQPADAAAEPGPAATDSSGSAAAGPDESSPVPGAMTGPAPSGSATLAPKDAPRLTDPQQDEEARPTAESADGSIAGAAWGADPVGSIAPVAPHDAPPGEPDAGSARSDIAAAAESGPRTLTVDGERGASPDVTDELYRARPVASHDAPPTGAETGDVEASARAAAASPTYGAAVQPPLTQTGDRPNASADSPRADEAESAPAAPPSSDGGSVTTHDVTSSTDVGGITSPDQAEHDAAQAVTTDSGSSVAPSGGPAATDTPPFGQPGGAPSAWPGLDRPWAPGPRTSGGADR